MRGAGSKVEGRDGQRSTFTSAAALCWAGLLATLVASVGFGCGAHDSAGRSPPDGAAETAGGGGGLGLGGAGAGDESTGLAGMGGVAGGDGDHAGTGAGAVGGAAGAVGGTGGAGGTGAGGDGVSADLSGGVEWDPWPEVDAAPAGSCVVSRFVGGDRFSAPKSVSKETWEYDATTRVLIRRHAPSGATAAWVGYVRVDSQGRRELICHAQSEFLCEDWTRDALGNAKSYSFFAVVDGPLDARTLDPAHPPNKAATAGAESENDLLTYDDAGRLSTAVYVFPRAGAALAFSRDDRGRCGDVSWAIPPDPSAAGADPGIREVDHWTYVGDKVVSRVVTNLNDPTDVRAVMTYAYDAEGALALTVVDGRLDFPDLPPAHPHPRDGVADYVVRSVRQSDGGRWVETIDFELDANNASVMRNGALTPAFRLRWSFSPACEVLSLPKHTSQDCEFERPTPMMPLGWRDPLLTPLQLWTASPLPD